ncbi:hypothetical protein ASG90_04950 [Nocardioides sp. Soil797]|nr:hypothetical protein ASG90_04950 [Nocardioides sp. Soil797]
MDTSPHLPPPQTVHQPIAKQRRWRPLVAGLAVGASLSAAIAVPLTWQLHDQSVTSSAMGSAATPAPASGNAGLPDQGGTGSTTLPQIDPGRASQQVQESTGEQASDAESTGVLLIESRLTDGAGAGTAMTIDSSGLALTNYHVVEGATEITATVAATGQTYPVEVVGHDASADVALLQLVGASDLDTVTVDDDGVSATEAVTAVGNAQGQGFLSAQGGAVTALGQEITAATGSGTANGSEDLTGLIETDASVVGGYSGGPLYDADGEVVGITTAADGDGTSSYAVPIDDALAVATRIESGHESGSTQIGPSAFLGVSVAASSSGGATVAGLEEGGPAAEAGIAAGDAITAIGSTSITTVDDLLDAVATHEPGDSVHLTWTTQAGATRNATVELGESPVA